MPRRVARPFGVSTSPGDGKGFHAGIAGTVLRLARSTLATTSVSRVAGAGHSRTVWQARDSTATTSSGSPGLL
jgi:hypothetical protein